MTVPAALSPYVAALVSYDSVGVPGVHIGMPSTRLTLVFTVGDPLDVGWAGDERSRGTYEANVAGLHAAPAEIRHGHRQAGVYVELTVAGARALLATPAGALAATVADAADVVPALRQVPERLAGTDPAAWEGVVVRALVEALAADAPGPRAEVGRALARLTRGAGVAEVAEGVGFSRRHLGDLVRAEAGVSPKQWQRLARFERSHALVRQGVAIVEVAHRCGYADQSHLTREWVELAGCSPTEWRRRELLPNVQDQEGRDSAR